MTVAFNALVALLETHSYFFIFALMFIEGPIVNFAAAFASALGVFNIWIIFILAIFGNQLPDSSLFFLGHKLRGKTMEKVVSYLGLNKKRIKAIERHLKENSTKTIIRFKVIDPIAVPGILIAGFMKVPFKKFFWIDLLMNFLQAILMTALGFYSGILVDTSLKYFKLSFYLLPIAVVLIFVVWFGIKRVYRLLTKFEKI